MHFPSPCFLASQNNTLGKRGTGGLTARIHLGNLLHSVIWLV